MAQNSLNEAALNLIRTFNATNRALTSSFITAQERHMHFTQAVFENSLTVLQSHTEATCTLTEEIIAQSDNPPAIAENIVDSTIAAYDRNLRLAQSIFNDSIEVLKDDAQDTQTLLHEIIEQGQRQQEQVMSFAQDLTHAYVDFLRMPLNYYRKAMDKTRTMA